MFKISIESLNGVELEGAVPAWTRSKALVFAIVVSAFNSGLFIVAGFTDVATVSIPHVPFPITTTFLLPMYGYLLPALFCLFVYPESRASLLKLKAGWLAYGVAIVAGQIPFLSYLGSHNPVVPVTVSVTSLFIVDFLVNLFLRPLWEQVIWRAVFQKRVQSFCSVKGAILLTSAAYTVWYGGYLAFLAHSVTSPEVVAVIGLIFFFWGVLLGSLYEISRGSLWACIVLQTGLTASEIVYYAKAQPPSELGPRLAELAFLAVAACLLFWFATRRQGASDGVSVQQTVQGI